ncbi:MAG: hypothetical protein OEW00_01430 [candidate division Zixibacteria bacterium]|nr:hypothetical protein [candidate division Zixibacteria bacterium]
MNYSRILAQGIIAGAILLAIADSASAGEGYGRVKLGYVGTDEEGNLGVNHETFNTYEGLAVSLEDFRYTDDHGFGFAADLKNLSLNNRSLYLSSYKPGLFNLSFNHNQYRRTYDFDGRQFTRRRSTGGQVSLQPIKKLKFFGGFVSTQKRGQRLTALSPVADTIFDASDYETHAFNLGAQAVHKYGSARVEYRGFLFYDDLNSDRDRKANSIGASLFARVPNREWMTFSGGYYHRTDQEYETALKVKTDQFWAGTKLYFQHAVTFDYRLALAGTEHTGEDRQTNRVTHTVAVGKTWPGHAGLRLGYERHTTDDTDNRTASNGYLFNGWYNWNQRLYVRARMALRNMSVEEGRTLTGDEDLTGHRLSVMYRLAEWGDLSGQWLGRTRENKDIGSEVDYDALSSELNLTKDGYGRLKAAYSYYLGEYESSTADFEFVDHVVSATIYPEAYRGLEADLNGTYYRSQRDKDIEKVNLSVGATYEFMAGHFLQVRYNLFTLDDFNFVNDYYTANIVEVNLIKDLKL